MTSDVHQYQREYERDKAFWYEGKEGKKEENWKFFQIGVTLTIFLEIYDKGSLYWNMLR